MPAYNAARTLRQTHEEVMAQGVVDQVIVVDDASHDETAVIAKTLPNTIIYTHQKNRGYGGNQKTCYKLALQAGADIVIMVHPDYQYTPKLIPAMAAMIQYLCYLSDRALRRKLHKHLTANSLSNSQLPAINSLCLASLE